MYTICIIQKTCENLIFTSFFSDILYMTYDIILLKLLHITLSNSSSS